MISIIIPVFNTGKALIRCVESFSSQTFCDKEIILVDDFSDDETRLLCDHLEKRIDQVKVIHLEKNSGVSEARNIGISNSKGEFLFFADSDDYAEKNMLELMVRLIIEKDVDLVITGFFYDLLTDKGMETIIQKAYKQLINCQQAIRSEMVKLWDEGLMYNIWNKLFRTSIVKKHNILFPKGKAFNEDRDFVREYLRYSNRLYITEECFYHYVRENKNAATAIYRKNMLEIRKEEYHKLINFFEEMKVDNYKEYVSREHMDRVIATIESTLGSNLEFKEKRNEIKRIVCDSDTRECIIFANPKSTKMKIIYILIKMKQYALIFGLMDCIHHLRVSNPKLYYILRQSR